MDALSITRTVRVNASQAKVWRAITAPEELGQWYAAGCRWEIPALSPGALVRFFNTETDVLSATIEVCEPPHRLVLRWHADPAYPATTVSNSFVLHEDGVETSVTIVQAGYESLPDGVRTQWIKQDEDALTAIAASLKAHVEADAPGDAHTG